MLIYVLVFFFVSINGMSTANPTWPQKIVFLECFHACVDTNAFMRVSCECFVSAFANAFVDTFMCAHNFCRFYATRQ